MQLPNHVQFETVSQATKLLEKRRILYEVHEALEQQKEEFSRRKEGLQRHEEIIREADINIQDHLIKYGQSLIEAEKKTKKTIDRLEYDQKDLNAIKEENAKEEATIANLQAHRHKFEMKIKSLAKYDEFLKQISMNKKVFSDTQEMLHRQKVLTTANNQLSNTLDDLKSSISMLKGQLKSVKNEKEEQKMKLNNELARLQEDVEVLENKKSNLQADIDMNMVSVHKQMQELAKLLMAIDNLNEITRKFVKNNYSMTKDAINARKGKANHVPIIPEGEMTSDSYADKCAVAKKKLDWIKTCAEDFKQIIEYAGTKKQR